MKSIIGSWKLVSFEVDDLGGDDGVRYPYGHDVSGVLIYEQHGSMCEIIAANTRPHVSAIDASFMLDKEKIAITEHFSAFAGTFKIQGDKIIHHIEVSFHTKWTGTTLERSYSFEDEKLSIRNSPIRFGEKLFELVTVWEKNA